MLPITFGKRTYWNGFVFRTDEHTNKFEKSLYLFFIRSRRIAFDCTPFLNDGSRYQTVHYHVTINDFQCSHRSYSTMVKVSYHCLVCNEIHLHCRPAACTHVPDVFVTREVTYTWDAAAGTSLRLILT